MNKILESRVYQFTNIEDLSIFISTIKEAFSEHLKYKLDIDINNKLNEVYVIISRKSSLLINQFSLN